MKPTHTPYTTLLAAATCLLLTLSSGFAQQNKKKAPATKIAWHDASTWGIEGRGWGKEDVQSFYDRLPAKAEKIVRPAVWGLSRHSSGLIVRFNTDASEISFRYRVGSERLAMPHMPATGVSGIDLYALAPDKQWRWVEVIRPGNSQDINGKVSGLDPSMRSYSAYLPLYNSVTKLEIGVPEGATFQPVAPRTEKPIVFYGTSITHGACASRPGITHPAILGRRLNRPIVNLGFSGNGRMEPEVGALLAEVDAAVYVIDCLPNMQPAQVAERCEPLVKKLREARSDTPIVLVEDRIFTNAWIRRQKQEFHAQNHSALARAYDKLISAGIKNLYYIEGDSLLGSDSEGATDGSHPNDLGFMRQAEIFEPILRKALKN